MARTYLPSQFGKTCEFGTVETTENPFTGAEMPGEFVSKFKLHYKPHTRTLNQQYLAAQANLSDTRVIVVRHNKRVTDELMVRLDGIVFKIVQVSPDETQGLNKYDFITLRKNEGIGNG